MKINAKHFAIAMVNGVVYALRDMQVSDVSLTHLDPKPKNAAKRIQFQGQYRAGDLITEILTKEDALRFDVKPAQFHEFNRAIVAQSPAYA